MISKSIIKEKFMNKSVNNKEYNFLEKSKRQEMMVQELNSSKGIRRKKEFALKFCVTERTISRDIKEILQKNNSILIISGRNGGYKNLKGNDGN